MIGPCLCGDPYCPWCGKTGLADLEAAEEEAIEALGKAKLSPNEYRMAVKIGLAAVEAAREMTRDAVANVREEYERYQASYMEPGTIDQP